ncbi:dephospho-CoA kinase [Kangiella sp. TOML190]|uniref:dephospho-CoA kinase n=1 Tax=Kangiella sp. TOML190 TaxID=2931351 RepID=UPI00203B4C74|nr:dephospho-CoA kinase [Kangiella sp. TOML190]
MSFAVALTGGIASGKTAVSDAFARLGVTVIDADLVARQVVSKGSYGLAQIKDYFGSQVINKDGSLNRKLLRSIVFEDETERQWLNQLLHPLIRQEMVQQRQQAQSAYSISVIPLLFETAFETDQAKTFDRILVIDCPAEVQLQRLMARDQTNQTQAKAILASQASREQRLSIADDVIDNSKDLQYLEHQVIKLHKHYVMLAE